MIRLGAIATGESMTLSSNMSFMKKWLDECLGVEPRRGGVALAEGLCDVGVMRAVPLSIIP
jgi:hypothetical protein